MADRGLPRPVTRVRIQELMEQSGVAFGTSGARGLVDAMTDAVVFAYTTAFLQYLEREGLRPRSAVALAGDLRPSSPRILRAVGAAVAARGYPVINCGEIPTPALALFGMTRGIPSIMVTGSHVPADRNGIKFYKPAGEILKNDEAGIREEVVAFAGLCGASGDLSSAYRLPDVAPEAAEEYVRRYRDFFPCDAFSGMRIGVYEHSSVARELLGEVLESLGAEVVRLGRADTFIPVDTEAIRPEDVELARRWCATERLGGIVSADGDGDRPLVGDAEGNWVRGDVAGVLCARFLGADTVVTPVSSSTVVERSGWFRRVIRTRIGSPFVIEAMQSAALEPGSVVVGYEANGGFLIGSGIVRDGVALAPLPTRDAMIVPLALLLLAGRAGGFGNLASSLPARCTASDRVKEFPTERSGELLRRLGAGLTEFNNVFGILCGEAAGADTTDGLRVTFRNGEIVHLRPSGNAPEFRCYVESDSAARSTELLSGCMQILMAWRDGTRSGGASEQPR